MTQPRGKGISEKRELPAIGPEDDLDEGSVKRLLKDIFPEPIDPLVDGLEKGGDFRLAKLYFPDEDGFTGEVTAYHALSDEARRKFMAHFFVEIEVADQKGNITRFFVSEYDAKRAERLGARRIRI